MQKIIALILTILQALFPCLPFLRAEYDAKPGKVYSSPFFAEGEEDAEALAELFNGIYALFGGSDEENSLVYRFGNEAAYYEWMADKLVWTDDEGYKDELKEKIVGYPQTDNGYLWSWGDTTYWPTGKGNMHYDGLFRYICAVAELTAWERSTALLNTVDETTCGNDKALDASQGRSVYEKCAAAMEYALEKLGGKDGIVTITEDSVFLADGVTRFDVNADGETVWNNTGRENSASSNYWDNFCFGHKDAYETVLFYKAANAMAEIETAMGHGEKAEEYRAAAAKTHESFDQYFWNEATGRYIGCIDADGKKHDFGFTFLNSEALAAGLGDREKAEKIFTWFDGSRTVSGDTVTGEDIRDYTKLLKGIDGKKHTNEDYNFVMRSTTLAVEERKTADGTWWESLGGSIVADSGENAGYGKHLENGGYIFWTVYYELAAYARYGYTEKIAQRIKELAEVYRFNGFDSDEGTWAEGLIGEFPENGIVSRIMVSALLGLDVKDGKLTLTPGLPEGCTAIGMENFTCFGKSYDVRLTKNAVILDAKETGIKLNAVFTRYGTEKITVVTYDENNKLLNTETLILNKSGKAQFRVSDPTVKTVAVIYA